MSVLGKNDGALLALFDDFRIGWLQDWPDVGWPAARGRRAWTRMLSLPFLSTPNRGGSWERHRKHVLLCHCLSVAGGRRFARNRPLRTFVHGLEHGERPRTIDVIGERVWAGLFTLIDTRIGDGSFGYRFPEQCPDGRGPYGCDGNAFGRVLTAEVPWSNWPLSHMDLPETPAILDILQFCATAVGAPIEQDFHPFFGHSHLSWDRDAGLTRFVNEVNLLFSRNAVAYELTAEGDARRLLPQPLAEALSWTIFATGDVETDRLLESARQGIALPKAEDRQDALEKLWDGFERLKTLEPGSDKRSQADALLDRVAKPGTKFRHFLGEEAMALTKIGNTFRIRHSETSQEALETLEQVDYLFGRLFALVRILLRGIGCGG